LSLLVLWGRDASLRTWASVPSAALAFVGAIVVCLLSQVEHTKSIKPSSIINVYLLGSILFDATQLRTLFLSGDNTPISAAMSASLGIKVILLYVEAQNKRSFLRRPYSNYSPEAISGIFSWSIFWWLNGLFKLGFRKLMTYDDLHEVDDALKSEALGRRMQEAWNRRSEFASVYTLQHVVDVVIHPFACICRIYLLASHAT
jgi:ATP-binding cassette subfamily C (CFTR/MRP) protein 1